MFSCISNAMQQSFLTGVFWILLSATSMAFVGLFAEAGFHYMSLTAMVLGRFVAAFIICFFWLLFSRQLRLFRLEHIKMNIWRSFFFFFAQYSFFYYLAHDTLLNGIVLLNAGPLFIPFVEKKLFGTKIGISSWVSLFISFIGVLFVLQPAEGFLSWVSLVGFFAGLSQAISQVLFGMNARKENTQVGTLSLLGFMVILSSLPYFLVNESTFTPVTHRSFAIGIIALLGLASVLNQFTRGLAYQHGTPSRLSPFLYFSVVWAGILDWIVFGTLPNALSIIGAILVIFAGALKIYLRRIILRKKNY